MDKHINRMNRKDSRASRRVYASEINGEFATYIPHKSSRNGVVIFAAAVFICVLIVALAVSVLLMGGLSLTVVVVAVLVAFIAASSIRIAPEWEKIVVLRFGRFSRVAGPGLYFTIPFLEHGTIHVDRRVVATPFYAESTLTADLVPVSVDAVLYWVVRDPEKACMEVEDYYAAVSLLAQTAMREAVGRSSVAEVALRRDQLDAEIERDIETEAASWGIDIIFVKVRDIVIPDELLSVMSLEARADREKSARMSVASVEVDLVEILSEAAQIYGDSSAALKLRTILMQYETVRESAGTVFTVPSAISDGFVDAAAQNNAKKEQNGRA